MYKNRLNISLSSTARGQKITFEQPVECSKSRCKINLISMNEHREESIKVFKDKLGAIVLKVWPGS